MPLFLDTCIINSSSAHLSISSLKAALNDKVSPCISTLFLSITKSLPNSKDLKTTEVLTSEEFIVIVTVFKSFLFVLIYNMVVY